MNYASTDAIHVAVAIRKLVYACVKGYDMDIINAQEHVAVEIDELLKNLLLAPVDHYTVK